LLFKDDKLKNPTEPSFFNMVKVNYMLKRKILDLDWSRNKCSHGVCSHSL